MRIDAKWVLGGLGVAAAAAVGAWYLRERSTERPNYRTIVEDEAYSLRAYPALLVAETTQRGRRSEALADGLGTLGDYLTARSRGGEEIAMTTPVIAIADGDQRWLTRLYMPGRWSFATLPTPPADIRLSEAPARRVAAIRFSGRADSRLFARKEKALRRWIEQKGLRAIGPAEHAYYSSPAVPGPLRHNEILIEVG
ncbi:MAG: heme-binding protein [Sphingomonas sanxanigenens]|uniref:Heme-binding protein n=1 Tax=Sphingomonas sanxanigenens TaxID=397260 RepID=A0A2W5C4E4_9SPHN|nr:MAG: heme-binding protein [Sphingomonas sanxanigenens]